MLNGLGGATEQGYGRLVVDDRPSDLAGDQPFHHPDAQGEQIVAVMGSGPAGAGPEHRTVSIRLMAGPHLRRLVDRVSAREAEVVGQSGPLARAAARAYAKLLAYKDEYEVARLLTLPSLQREMAQVFAAGGRVSFNLAPPFLAGRGIKGRPRKREFGPWLRPALRILARGRRLRGTVFDLFGYTAERRAERALIAQYEQLVARVLAALTAANHPAGVELLALAEEVRGFGPVKEAAMLRYHDRAQSLEQAFRAARENPANA